MPAPGRDLLWRHGPQRGGSATRGRGQVRSTVTGSTSGEVRTLPSLGGGPRGTRGEDDSRTPRRGLWGPPPAPGRPHSCEQRTLYYLVHPGCGTSKLSVSFWNVHLRFSAAGADTRCPRSQEKSPVAPVHLPSQGRSHRTRPARPPAACGQDGLCSVSVGPVGTQVLRTTGRG